MYEKGFITWTIEPTGVTNYQRITFNNAVKAVRDFLVAKLGFIHVNTFNDSPTTYATAFLTEPTTGGMYGVGFDTNQQIFRSGFMDNAVSTSASPAAGMFFTQSQIVDLPSVQNGTKPSFSYVIATGAQGQFCLYIDNVCSFVIRVQGTNAQFTKTVVRGTSFPQPGSSGATQLGDIHLSGGVSVLPAITFLTDLVPTTISVTPPSMLAPVASNGAAYITNLKNLIASGAVEARDIIKFNDKYYIVLSWRICMEITI